MLVEKAAGSYTDFRIPGVVATERGTLLRYCECRRDSSDWADIDIKVSRSEDMGKSWEDVLLIKSGGNTMNNPVMFVNGDELIFLYCKNYKEIWKYTSEDDGKTFGNNERVDFESSVDFFYNVVAVGPGHGIVHNGRLIVPVWFAYNKEDEKAHAPSLVSTIYSDDGGKTWRVGETVVAENLINANESALAVTADGDFLMSIRHSGNGIKKRALARSSDGISEWHGLRYADTLPDPICMGSMTHRDGVIYHVNCASDSGRTNLTVKISEDCFKTYRSIFVSEPAGYSDIALVGDKICVFYEKVNAENSRFELFFEVLDING